jgi:hypothetical protein
MTSVIPYVLGVIGSITALAGLFALLPARVLSARLPLEPLSPAGWFFLCHWAILVVLCGVVLIVASRVPAWRDPAIFLVGTEKLIFSGLALAQPPGALRRALRPAALADLLAAGLLAACWFASR